MARLVLARLLGRYRVWSAKLGSACKSAPLNDVCEFWHPTGSQLATCSGTLADGAPLDTASEGQKAFTVTGTDGAGNTTTSTVSYRVALPAITIGNTSAAEGLAAALTVTLSHPSHVPITVRYATRTGRRESAPTTSERPAG
jgi:hypothetical protein